MARPVTPKTPTIDWAGLKRRTRQVTRTSSVFTYVPGNDGKTLIFVGSEGGAGRRWPWRIRRARRRRNSVDLHDPG